jgi:F-type H+-transporting ATPase subunit a
MSPMPSPLEAEILFRIGSIPIARPVVTTSAIVLLFGVLSWASTRRMTMRPGRWQAALEAVVAQVTDQVREIVGRDPAPFLPVLGTLFLFIVVANLSGLLPGVRAPTASIETPAALAIVVFLSAHFYGIRERGVKRYLASYLKPNPVMLPLNVLSEITRTFSLMVRLFGNMMSHEIVLGIVATIAGLLVPIPFMALGILVGVIQAYIFSILATVFVGAAIGATEAPEKGGSP